MSHLFLGHLSPDCNTPDLAQKVASGKLDEMGASHISVSVARQETVSAFIQLE